jgi:hypothetical protein
VNIEKQSTRMNLDPENEEVDSEDLYNIEKITERELELIESGLEAAFLMEEPAKTTIEKEDVEDMIQDIQEALKDPEQRLQERQEERKE